MKYDDVKVVIDTRVKVFSLTLNIVNEENYLNTFCRIYQDIYYRNDKRPTIVYYIACKCYIFSWPRGGKHTHTHTHTHKHTHIHAHTDRRNPQF